jgi:hypothetical protein
MTTAVARAGRAACCDDPQDAAWGRLTGAAPPLPTWIPAAVAAVVVLVLALVIVLVVRPPGPLDDPNPANQRDGLLRDGPALPPEAAGVRFGGRPVVVLFERIEPAGPAFQAWKAAVADDGVELVVRVGSAGDELARLVGMPTPVDGKRPVGYAVVDTSRTVRYATLDPAYEKNAFEVDVITGAIS